MKRRRWPWVVLALLLACGAAYSWWAGLDRARKIKALEAAEAREAGLIVAVEESQRELDERTREIKTLQLQIQQVRGTVPDAEVIEIVKWRTDTIEVPVEKIVPGDCPLPQTTVQPPVVPRPVPTPAGPSPGTVLFQVRGNEARLESRAGNHFAVGEVELWRLDPDELLGGASWDTDVTELVVQAEKPQFPWRLSFLLGIGGPDFSELVAGANWQGRSRWGLWGTLGYDLSPSEYYQVGNDIASYQSTQSVHGAVGVSFTVGRR